MTYAETDWRSKLSPEVRDNPMIERFDTPEKLFSSFQNANSLITGGEKLIMPKDEADPNWQAVYNRLGRPEKSDGYRMPVFKDLPKGLEVNLEGFKPTLEKLHAAGASQKVIEIAINDYVAEKVEVHNGSYKKIEDANTAAQALLRKEWGTGYDANAQLADKTLIHGAKGDKDLSKRLAEKYGNDPDMIRVLANLGNEFHEDVMGIGSSRPGDLTPAAAQMKINEILQNPGHAYFNGQDPAHNQAVEQVTQLHQLVDQGEAS